MKIAAINGSPRKGNTLAAINAFLEGAQTDNEIQLIEPDKLNISGCKGCGACQCHKGCIATDDSNPTIDMLVEADMILFATPVYWWGMTAQLKMLIDKCYCRGTQLKGKKIGIIIVGGASTDNVQYELISKQFECMAQYLSWEILFCESYSANAKDDLASNASSIAELRNLGNQLN